MPILYTTPPAPPPEPVKSRTIPQDYPCKHIIWHSPNGETINFKSYPFQMLPGRSGFGRVQHDVVNDRLVDGTHFVQNYRPGTRLISIPLAVNTNQDQLDSAAELMRETYALMDRGFQHITCSGRIKPGTLEILLHDGERRYIDAYYQNGFDGSEDIVDDLMLGYAEFPNLEFWCPSPIFLGEEVRLTYYVQRDSDPFYPIYPIELGTASLGERRVFDNQSPEPIYPVWTFTGPGEPVLENTETEETLTFNRELDPGEQVMIDTRPISEQPDTGKTIYDPETGEDRSDIVDGNMFTICPGQTEVNFSMAGVTGSGSRLVLEYRNRFMRGW